MLSNVLNPNMIEDLRSPSLRIPLSFPYDIMPKFSHVNLLGKKQLSLKGAIEYASCLELPI